MMPEPTADSFHVSPQQAERWLAEPEGPFARLQALFTLAGRVDVVALEDALARSVARHEILRTTFARQPGIRVPLQVVHEQLPPLWNAIDVRSQGDAERAAALAAARRAELSEPFDLEHGPLVRAVLVTEAEDRHTLILTLSSLCADASSIPVLAVELIHNLGGEESLAQDPLQYADFAAWQRELVGSGDETARAAGEFWKRLESAASPALPFAKNSSARFVPEEVDFELDAATATALTAQSARYGTTVATFVQAAWHALIGRSSGEEDVVLGYVSLERRHADLEAAIGAFARTLPIRARVADAVTFAELAAEVERSCDEVAEWHDYAPQGQDRAATIGFVCPEPYRGRAGELALSIERVSTAGGPFALWVVCDEGAHGSRLRLCFDPACFEREFVERLAGRFKRVLAAVAADASVELGSIEILDDAERARLLVDFNATAAPIPDACVHELIAARAAASPQRTAVVDEHGAVTYAELDARSNQLAQRLARAGVGPDVPVGLCTDRSIEMIVGLLGILKAGGAYLPLNFEHPAARLAHQLTTAGAAAIVTQEALLERLPDFGGEIVCLDRDRAALCSELETAPAVEVSHANLVYVIYTSGSTGTPKGVAVTHGNLVNYATDIARRVGAAAEPLTFATVTSIATDLGNTAVFGALCSGGTLVLVSPTAAADGAAIAALFDRTAVDVLKITPSHLRALLASRDPRVLPARQLVLGGERSAWDLIEAIRELSDCPILNHYGPTETTVGSTTTPVADAPGPFGPATVPIGSPIANTRCYVLDGRGQPVPLGVRGSLFIAGAGVARGYIGAPELTVERFVADPFASEPGARMYDTGDLARWLPDGTLEFLGRADEQLKIRGYRVEPAEIETALREHLAVREAVVVPSTGGGGDVRLVAYCAVDGSVGEGELRDHLAQRLPEFMIPSVIGVLGELPMTPSGKVDRLALPDPSMLEQPSADYVAPSTPMEQVLAEIWAAVLRVERVGVEDDFFALGGHSLLATQVVAQVRSDFAVDLPLHSLFSYPTVASLTAEIVRMMGDSEQDETARLVAELEGLSDEEAERMLAGESAPPDGAPRR
jgi:amino acid adenylation domain-containing protein